jgi:hypothetical protein
MLGLVKNQVMLLPITDQMGWLAADIGEKQQVVHSVTMHNTHQCVSLSMRRLVPRRIMQTLRVYARRQELVALG